MVLRDSQLLIPYTSPYLPDYPEAAKQKATRDLVFWTTDRESYIGVGYNKNILPAADVPEKLRRSVKAGAERKIGDQQRRRCRSIYGYYDQIEGRRLS